MLLDYIGLHGSCSPPPIGVCVSGVWGICVGPKGDTLGLVSTWPWVNLDTAPNSQYVFPSLLSLLVLVLSLNMEVCVKPITCSPHEFWDEDFLVVNPSWDCWGETILFLLLLPCESYPPPLPHLHDHPLVDLPLCTVVLDFWSTFSTSKISLPFIGKTTWKC